MSTYKLTKNDGVVSILKDGVDLGLFTEVYDFNVTSHGWGTSSSDWRQIAFALSYDILKDKDKALVNYTILNYIFSHAVPDVLEFDSSVIVNLMDPETFTPQAPEQPPVTLLNPE